MGAVPTRKLDRINPQLLPHLFAPEVWTKCPVFSAQDVRRWHVRPASQGVGFGQNTSGISELTGGQCPCRHVGSQSWKRYCTATASFFVGSLPIQSRQNISGFASSCSIGLFPISGTKAARNTILETAQYAGRSGKKIPLTECPTTTGASVEPRIASAIACAYRDALASGSSASRSGETTRCPRFCNSGTSRAHPEAFCVDPWTRQNRLMSYYLRSGGSAMVSNISIRQPRKTWRSSTALLRT